MEVREIKQWFDEGWEKRGDGKGGDGMGWDGKGVDKIEDEEWVSTSDLLIQLGIGIGIRIRLGSK